MLNNTNNSNLIVHESTSYSLKAHFLRYIGLMKPKIISLLALTGLVAFLLPTTGSYSILDVVWFLICGSSAAGGAMTINNIIDQDIDQEMTRTESRASVGSDKYSSHYILLFGGSLMIFGIVGGYLWFGPLTALHLLWGAAFYILGYSFILKRNTVLNTFLGGLASPAPVWAAYAARSELAGVDHHFLGVPTIGWLIGWLVFLWTPTHTWTMAVKNYLDYEKVNIPMLPVIIGIPKTATITLIGGLGIIGYASYILFLVSIPGMVVSFVLHGLFFRALWEFWKNPTIEMGRKCFIWHNIWLTVIFLLLLI